MVLSTVIKLFVPRYPIGSLGFIIPNVSSFSGYQTQGNDNETDSEMMGVGWAGLLKGLSQNCRRLGKWRERKGGLCSAV